MSLQKDIGIVTELCMTENIAEVELITLVKEEIPLYRLRSDDATTFSGYKNTDWYIDNTDPKEENNLEFTTEQLEETLNYFDVPKSSLSFEINHKHMKLENNVMQEDYNFDTEVKSELTDARDHNFDEDILMDIISSNSFLIGLVERVLCGDRVSQMIKTYNDIEAVTNLLEEKEKDLELAARIGQSLLARNKYLEDRNAFLENEMSTIHDELIQLRYDLSMKSDLLKQFNYNYIIDSETDSNKSTRFANLCLLHAKIRILNEENKNLRKDAIKLKEITKECELKEKKLLNTIFRELGKATNQSKILASELNRKTKNNLKQQEEITNLLSHICDLQVQKKQLIFENKELGKCLKAAREIQNELKKELLDFKCRYSEVLSLYEGAREELKRINQNRIQSSSLHSNLHILNPFDTGKFQSLAFELECSCSNLSDKDQFEKYGNICKVFDLYRFVSKLSTANSACHRLKIFPFYENNSREFHCYKDINSQDTYSLDSAIHSDNDDILPNQILAISKKFHNQIIKPMEGSKMLANWARLARPHMAGLFEERPGIQIRGGKSLEELDDIHNINDIEEEIVVERNILL